MGKLWPSPAGFVPGTLHRYVHSNLLQLGIGFTCIISQNWWFCPVDLRKHHQKPCRNICQGILQTLHNVTDGLHSIKPLMNLRQSCNNLVTKTNYGEVSLPIGLVEEYIMKLWKTHNFGHHYKIRLQRPIHCKATRHASNINIVTKEQEHEGGGDIFMRWKQMEEGLLKKVYYCFFLCSRRFQNKGWREVGWQRLGDTCSSACLAQSFSQIITSGL